jgi:cell division transport system permease protein
MRSHFVLQEIWIGLRRNLTMTMALIVVVAISLSLLGTGLLFVKQVDRTRTYWQGKVELSIYLCIKTSPQPQCQRNGPATDAERAQLQQRLKSMPQVETVYYVNQQQAYRSSGSTSPTSRPGPGHPGRRHPGLVPGEAEEPRG